MPYLPGDVPASVVTKWFDDTVSQLKDTFWSPDAKKAGVGLLSAYMIFETESYEPLFFADALVSYRQLTRKEMSMFPPNYKSGVFLTTYYAEGTKYLPFLLNRFKELGGKVIQKRINDLSELAGIFDIVINCPGLEARTLVKDEKVVPIRGQLLRVRAPWLKHAIIAGDSYMLPNTDLVVVGGTRTVGDWNRNVDPEDTKTIFNNACKILPSLRDAEIANVWVGLRPSRDKPRIERETLQFGSNQLEVIHNYGHGGSGITLSWGCANDAIRLLTQVVATKTNASSLKSNL